MNQCVLGIDLGTSSVKIVKKYKNGHTEKLKNTNEAPLPLGWWDAVCKLLGEIDWKEVAAIGLSSQVGTYLVNDKEVISWNHDVGKEELKWWKTKYSTERFVEEISMPHPDIISYPLPRLKYIIEHFDGIQKICQPKEYILEKLTGEWVTDMYSWRGLVNLNEGTYSGYFLKELSLEEGKLPVIKGMDEVAGYTKEVRIECNILPAGIPVYVGLNDFYAGLLGMGVGKTGQMFDVTGTSEHLGVVEENIDKNTDLVSGPYIKHMVRYGVTASSGPSIKYALKLIQEQNVNFLKTEKMHAEDIVFGLEDIIKKKPPIFLPYVKGERAPIWNADARGVFFGIEEKCSSVDMAYAIMEGVVFSLYHIYETMGMPEIQRITVSGGAAEIECLNWLKAEIFGVPIDIVKESDVSALGACMTAAVGLGWYKNYEETAKEWVTIARNKVPSGRYKQWFVKRFKLYKELYYKVEPLFEKWKEIEV